MEAKCPRHFVFDVTVFTYLVCRSSAKWVSNRSWTRQWSGCSPLAAFLGNLWGSIENFVCRFNPYAKKDRRLGFDTSVPLGRSASALSEGGTECWRVRTLMIVRGLAVA